MYKNIAIAVLCLGFIVGCGDKESPTVMAKPEAGQGNANKVEKTKSETAIYLPGGAGIDFGKPPLSDEILRDSTKNYRLVTYEFDDDFNVIDKALAGVLASKSYVRTENSVTADVNLSTSYNKPDSNTVLVRYRQSVREGFTKKTIVLLSWYVE